MAEDTVWAARQRQGETQLAAVAGDGGLVAVDELCGGACPVYRPIDHSIQPGPITIREPSREAALVQ